MPIVNISLIEGRDPAAVSACVKAVARTIHETLGAPLNSIRVIATEVRAEYWSVGDETKAEQKATNGTKPANEAELE
jgi:4-oxalocrotonate tautomerase